MWSGSCPFMTFCTRSGTTWLMARLTLPERMSTSCSALRSPMPTQLNGRKMVKGRPYWEWAARAKYSTASFWNPYDETGGGISCSCPSVDGHDVVDSNTIDDDRYVTFWSRPSR